MFKVLVISYYFPPMGLSGVQRTLKFVKYMKRLNWEPTVLTTQATAYYAHDLSLLKEVEDNNINVVRVAGADINSVLASKGTVKIPREFIRKILSRISAAIFIPDNKIGWTKKAIVTARELLKNEEFDLIFVSAPPFSTVNMAVELKKEFDIPLVIDYRDLWYGFQFAFYPTPIHKYLHKKMEYRALKKADKVIATNRKMKEKLISFYPFLSFEDIVIIPHGYDPDDFANLKVEVKKSNKMYLAYSGSFYEYITPKFFLQAFKELSLEKPEITANIELHFIGYLRTENVKMIKKLKLQEFVKAYGYLKHEESLSKIMMADVLWFMVGHGRNDDTISSGKLYEYIGTQKPIIACVPEGALKLSAQEYGAAIVTEPDNIQQIKNAIVQSYELYRNNSLPKPNVEFVEKHRRDFLTEQLVKQFQFLIREK
jgi:glycosyltransferase involved in cell wall biosynthesis